MANSLIRKTLISVRNPLLFKSASSRNCYISSIATAEQPQSDGPSLSFTFSSDGQQEHKADNNIYVKAPSSNPRRETASSSSSVTMPMSFMTGSIVGKRFYKQVTIREADDGNGWTVMLDYRTLKTPSKRPLKLPTSSLAKAIAAEWEYQVRCFYYCLFQQFSSLALMGLLQFRIFFFFFWHLNYVIVGL